jgi:Sec-independent protein translocase protein TatA
MFGFGITEIITIIVVIIVLVNPRDLPVIVRKTGKIYGSIMKQINGVRKSFTTFEEEVKTAASFSEDEIFVNRKKRAGSSGPKSFKTKIK